MESLLTPDYLLVCFCTILVAVTGLLGPQVMERDMPVTYSADDASKMHCKTFGWPMFIGGIVLLFGFIGSWGTLTLVIAFEALMFGVMYFVGLLAYEHDKATVARRCRAVCHRYQESIRAFFGERGSNDERKKPDLEFMKRVEAHADVAPDKVIAMRIRIAQMLQSDTACNGEVGAMVDRYVRSGGPA